MNPALNLQTYTVNEGWSSSFRGSPDAPKNAFEELSIIAEFSDVVAQASTIDVLLPHVGTVIQKHSQCLGMWVSQRSGNGSFEAIHSMLNELDKVLWETISPIARPMLNQAVENGKIQAFTMIDASSHLIVVAPVRVGKSIDLVFGGCFAVGDTTALRQQWLMGIASQAIVIWFQSKNLQQLNLSSRSLNDLVTITNVISQSKSLRNLSMAVVNQLRRVTDAEQVAFCRVNESGATELVAVSDLETVDTAAESNQMILAAAAQSIRAEQSLSYPPIENDLEATDLLPLETWCRQNGTGGCISIPMYSTDESPLGSILISTEPEKLRQPAFDEYLQNLLPLLARHIEVATRANRSLPRIAIQESMNLVSGRLFRVIALALFAVAVLMMVPIPYKIGCDCELQPVMRRYIAAPHDGLLQRSLVKNGEIVRKDQIVAELDGRQLRIELAGLEAEHEGARKKRNSARAVADYAQAQIAASEVSRLSARIQLVNEKLKNLDIRSPIDGIVIVGDLEKAEKAPVEMGQTLFEVAPLQAMVAEIAIPESEIPYAKPGMPVRVKLNAFPFESWDGEIEKIHSRAEVLNSENVFIAEVRLANRNLKLKPGMKGSAKIRSGNNPVGWNLFHHAYEKLRYWMIW